MVRIDQSCSTFVVVQDTAIGIDWQFTYGLPVIHLPTKSLNSRFNCPRSLALILTPELPHFSFLFRFSSSLLTLTMRTLLFLLVFATKEAADPVDNSNEWDFRRQQDNLGIVNGLHSISGAAFTPGPPIV